MYVTRVVLTETNVHFYFISFLNTFKEKLNDFLLFLDNICKTTQHSLNKMNISKIHKKHFVLSTTTSVHGYNVHWKRIRNGRDSSTFLRIFTADQNSNRDQRSKNDCNLKRNGPERQTRL